MNQAELQTLTSERLLDAEALILGRRWSFAYYAAGYAVECALKSCVLARMIHTGWVFQEKTKKEDCRTHQFNELIQIAGLQELLNEMLAADNAFVRNWGTFSAWSVEVRYAPKTEAVAIALRDAIIDRKNGVLPWIKKHW